MKAYWVMLMCVVPALAGAERGRQGQLTVFRETLKDGRTVERIINKGATFDGLHTTNYRMENKPIALGMGHGLGGAQYMRKKIKDGGDPRTVPSDYHNKVSAFADGFKIINFFYHHLHLSQYPEVPDGFGFPRLATTMAKTKNSDVGVAVTDQQRAFPVDLASDVRTIEIDGGFPVEIDGRLMGRIRKVMLGIGAGETENLTDLMRHLLGHDKATNAKKVRMLREFGEVLLGTWQATDRHPFTYDGEFFKVTNAYIQQPETGALQLGFAGQGPESIKVAADLGVWYMPITFTLEGLTQSYNQIKNRMTKVGRQKDIELYGFGNIIETRPLDYTAINKKTGKPIDLESDWQNIRNATLQQFNKDANWKALLTPSQYDSLNKEDSFESVYAQITFDNAEQKKAELLEKTLNHPYLHILEPAVRRTLAHGNTEELIAGLKRQVDAGTNLFIFRMHGSNLQKSLDLLAPALNALAVEKIAPFQF